MTRNHVACGRRPLRQLATSMAASGGQVLLIDASRENPMLRSNPAQTMVRPRQASRPAAASPKGRGHQCQHAERQRTVWRRILSAQTSRLEFPATDPTSNQRGCSGRTSHRLCRRLHEFGPGTLPTDATDTEPRALRSRGRSDAEFYNLRRPHQSLGHRTPMTVWREGVSGVLDDVAVAMTLRLGQRCRVAHILCTPTAPAYSLS